MAVRTLRRRIQLGLLLLALLLVAQALLNGLRYDGELPKAALVLTAHPDDEVMFFAPTVLALTAAGVQVYALCLSSGNDQGLGHIRKHELLGSYEALGVLPARVSILDDPLLQDGMHNQWDPVHIAAELGLHLGKLPEQIDAIITFGAAGISYHPNHGACNAAAELVQSAPTYVIRTSSVLVKFASLPMALIETLLHRSSRTKEGLATTIHSLSSLSYYLRSLSAMRQHDSQLVWFRYFYLVLSKYMYSNTLFLLN